MILMIFSFGVFLIQKQKKKHQPWKKNKKKESAIEIEQNIGAATSHPRESVGIHEEGDQTFPSRPLGLGRRQVEREKNENIEKGSEGQGEREGGGTGKWTTI